MRILAVSATLVWGLGAGAAAPAEVRELRIAGAGAPGGVVTRVVLPPGWRPGSPARLMVFLHDGRGSERSFEKHGLAALVVALQRDGVLPPVLVASPRIRGTFVTDSPRAAMESFLAGALVPALEEAFPGVGGSRGARTVWGISMGGYGALKLGLRHPGVFGRAAALAPWVQHLSWTGYAAHRGLVGRRVLEPVFGASREESRFEANDLFGIVEAADPAAAPPLFVRTGSRDRWEQGASELLDLLRSRGFAVDAASVPEARHAWRDWMREAAGVFRWLLAPAP